MRVFRVLLRHWFPTMSHPSALELQLPGIPASTTSGKAFWQEHLGYSRSGTTVLRGATFYGPLREIIKISIVIAAVASGYIKICHLRWLSHVMVGAGSGLPSALPDFFLIKLHILREFLNLSFLQPGKH